MRVNYCEYSSIGGRSKNEDMVQIVSYPESTIVLVADGLGGHRDGDVASRMTVHTICEEIRDGSASRMLMEQAIRKANEKIMLRHADGRDMKTTIAVVWLNEDHACAANVGDTRIYQFRDGEIVFQSVDHSASQLAVMLGEISSENIRHHCDRNRLTRAIGAREDIKIDSEILDVRNGDAFLLCSDGFWEHVWEKEMLEDLEKSSDARSWLHMMRKRVEERLKKNADNHTAAVLIITE